MNDGDKKAWRARLDCYRSDDLREVKKLIDEVLADREEFFGGTP